MNENTTRKCRGCNDILSIAKFSKSKKHKDGRETKCTPCRHKDSKNYFYVCVICGEDYVTKKKTSNQSCSPTCNGKLRTLLNTVSVTCSNCEKPFIKKLSQVMNNNYCSMECVAVSVSERQSGNFMAREEVICTYCKGSIFRLKSQLNAKHFFCDKDCLRLGIGDTRRGAKSSCYKPELTKEDRIRDRNYEEYRNWRKEVYKRDNYTCKVCHESKSGELNAHHLYSYTSFPELGVDVDNGVTLCIPCHKEFHRTFGYHNSTKKQFEDFLLLKSSTKDVV